jgi:hypothetical protein
MGFFLYFDQTLMDNHKLITIFIFAFFKKHNKNMIFIF